MIKRLTVLAVVLVFMLSATSCGLPGNPTEKYLLAMQNTLNADSVESSSKIEIKLDIAKTKDSLKAKLEKFKEITVNTNNSIDKKAKKQAIDSFLNIGGIPVDFKAYADGDNAYIKSSFLGDKYFKASMSEEVKNNAENINNIDLAEYKTLTDEAKKIWVDAVKNEIISSEGTSVENTPDGDIKVTNLALELTDEKEKNILEKLADLLSTNEFLLDQAKKGSEQYGPKDANRDTVNKEIEKFFKNLPENMRKQRDNYTLDTLKLTVKVDKDSYIISQSLSGGITIKGDDVGELKIGFKFEETYWNINRKVNISIPQIKKEDLGDWKDLDTSNTEYMEEFKEKFNIK